MIMQLGSLRIQIDSLTCLVSDVLLFPKGIDLDPERTHLHEQRWRGVQLTDSL